MAVMSHQFKEDFFQVSEGSEFYWFADAFSNAPFDKCSIPYFYTGVVLGKTAKLFLRILLCNVLFAQSVSSVATYSTAMCAVASRTLENKLWCFTAAYIGI